MKKSSFTNSRAKTIKSDFVITNYLATYEHAYTESAHKTNEFIHTSIIFLYLAQLICLIEKNSIDIKYLKTIYRSLGEEFKFKLFDFTDVFLIHLATREFSYAPEELGYVIDSVQQLHLANKGSDEIEFVKSSGYRKMRGAFFTPYSIAKLIVDKSLDQLSLNKISKPKILDMGCGTGVFCSATAHGLLQNGHSKNLILNGLLSGFDVEPLSAIISKIIVQAELHVPLNEIKNLDFIQVRDVLFGDLDFGLFSDAEISEKYDAIVMNPPYDRLKADGGSPSEKELVERKIKYLKTNPIFKNSSSGSIDLYRLFIEKGTSLLTPKGVMGAIVPLSFLADKSASGIRKAFLDSNSLIELIVFPEKAKIFENVTQACSIFFINLANTSSEVSVSKMKTASELDSKIKVSTSIIKSTSPDLCPIPLVDKKEIGLLKKLSSFPRLRDINGLTNKRGELDLTLDKQFLNGKDKCLLKGASVGQYHFKEIFHVDFNAFVESKSNSSRIKDVYLTRIAGQQISNIDSSIRLKFSLIPPKFILGNSLNYLTVNEENFNNSFNIFTLLALLNSSILNWRFKLTSSNNHVNNYEIDDLPMPIYADREKIELVNNLANSLISSKPETLSGNDLLRKIDVAVLDCYGISQDEYLIN